MEGRSQPEGAGSARSWELTRQAASLAETDSFSFNERTCLKRITMTSVPSLWSPNERMGTPHPSRTKLKKLKVGRVYFGYSSKAGP